MSEPQVLFYHGWYSGDLCRENPERVFVFGDNLLRHGMGGQAVIRNEPNVYGVATKRSPSMSRDAFFREGDEADRKALVGDLAGLRQLLVDGKTVVIPRDRATDKVALGNGLARLPEYAPSLYELIENAVDALASEFGSVTVVPSKLSSADKNPHP